jgi:hypothetical protein
MDYNTRERRLHQSIEGVSGMAEIVKQDEGVTTGARQTMATWTHRIETCDQVPAVYRDRFSEQALPYLLLLPPIPRGTGRTSEKLVYEQGDAIHILEHKDGRVIETVHSYSDVFMLETGSVLLDSWLTIGSRTNSAETVRTTLDFNTSSARYYQGFMEKLRPRASGRQAACLEEEKEKLNPLMTQSYKFMNFGRASLVEGAFVRDLIFQPQVNAPRFPLFGNLIQKLVTPSQLTILTDQELICIQELPSAGWNQKNNYGSLWQYIRLDAIQSAICLQEDSVTVLKIHLPAGIVVQKIFTISNREKVIELSEKLGE